MDGLLISMPTVLPSEVSVILAPWLPAESEKNRLNVTGPSVSFRFTTRWVLWTLPLSSAFTIVVSFIMIEITLFNPSLDIHSRAILSDVVAQLLLSALFVEIPIESKVGIISSTWMIVPSDKPCVSLPALSMIFVVKIAFILSA